MKKQLTILHSNDLHGAFLPVEKDGKEVGGLALLKGKIEEIRSEKENVIYAIAGDLFRGSIIDSEFKGLSTIELINLLEPDLVTIGNHEVDYGLAHLLFLEKCARFDIINANMYVNSTSRRMFSPYKIIEINGMKILFIGLVTDEIMATVKSDTLIGSYITIKNALDEVRTIVDSYRTVDVDMTVLITHIGFEMDKELAKMIDDKLRIDLIIGAHSHTLLNKAKVVNNIPIVQVGSTSDHLGQIDVEIDTDKHKMTDFKWNVHNIDSENCKPNQLMVDAISAYKKETDQKFAQVLTIFHRELNHPSRHEETELGNLFADLMQEDSSFDVMFTGNGSIRKKTMGPVVRIQDLHECYPFNNSIWMITVNGKQFRDMCHFYLKASVDTNGESEFYSVSKGVFLTYNYKEDKMERCEFRNKEVEDNDSIKIALQDFHLNNFEDFFGFPLPDEPVLVVNDDLAVYEEMLLNRKDVDSKVEGRIVIIR